MSDKKEMSQERRTLVAAVLALAVIVIFSYLYPVKPPSPPATHPPGAAAPGSAPANLPPTPGQQVGAPITSVAPTTGHAPPPQAAAAERLITIDTGRQGLYRIVLSNRGAVVRSWLLNHYTDDHNPPRTLDVVHADVSEQSGWPLSLVLDDSQQEAAANAGLYEVTLGGGAATKQNAAAITLQTPAEVDFSWSDGHLAVTKKLKFDASYIAELETAVTRDGAPIPFSVAWRGGFGDETAYHASLSTYVFYSQEGKFERMSYKNLGQPKEPDAKKTQPGPLEFTGIDDAYFAAAFLPPLETSGPRQGLPATLEAAMNLTDWTFERDVVTAEGKTEKEFVPEMAVGNGGGAQNLRLFVGPKNLDELKAIRPPLNQLVQFGWLAIIAEPLFYALRWIHGWVPNYGWAIVVMTVAINMLLMPLKVKTLRSSQKMQKVAPEIRSIQDRYKKYSMRDPRKAKMQEEIMAVYSREGINPLGGCLPQLIQAPIWYGLYRMLTVTIELRHAPWIGWIHDLSARDPYYLLPIAMGVTMYIAQKMTPMPATDPSQQRMMALMPIMFGGMFIIIPIASGLTLYILTSNLVNMAQQWYLNRTMPAPAPTKALKKRK
jgi:YidC/Oxa1 family membrane protein insertase